MWLWPVFRNSRFLPLFLFLEQILVMFQKLLKGLVQQFELFEVNSVLIFHSFAAIFIFWQRKIQFSNFLIEKVNFFTLSFLYQNQFTYIFIFSPVVRYENFYCIVFLLDFFSHFFNIFLILVQNQILLVLGDELFVQQTDQILKIVVFEVIYVFHIWNQRFKHFVSEVGISQIWRRGFEQIYVLGHLLTFLFFLFQSDANFEVLFLQFIFLLFDKVEFLWDIIDTFLQILYLEKFLTELFSIVFKFLFQLANFVFQFNILLFQSLVLYLKFTFVGFEIHVLMSL